MRKIYQCRACGEISRYSDLIKRSYKYGSVRLDRLCCPNCTSTQITNIGLGWRLDILDDWHNYINEEKEENDDDDEE